MDGTLIGQYRIERKLGEGGMGAVYLAVHTLLGRRAAIKVLLTEFTANESIVQRFFNEARAVTAIADPGIVQVFDFGHHTDGSAYLVMELLDGEAMDARLKRIGRFAPVDAVRLMAQIATSLGAAHAKGVIHRDLKPENIFIVGDPAVTGGERSKILDFGIAKLAGDEPGKMKTRTGMVMGTPVYMSPEQCRGASTLDHRSDIYALGCVLFAMLCGRPPFEAEGSGDLIIMHVRDQPPRPSMLTPGLPGDLEAIILRCLEKHPDARFQSTQELAHALLAMEAQLYGLSPEMMRASGMVTAAGAYGSTATPAFGAFKRMLTPGTNPGMHPGTQPGTQPGSHPGTHPGSHPGTHPGTHPGSASPTQATTLGSATGAFAPSLPAKRRTGLGLFVAIAGLLIVGGGVGIAVTQGGGAPTTTPVAAPTDAPGSASAGSAATAAGSAAPTPTPVVVDAGPTEIAQPAVTLDAGPAPADAPTEVATTPPDAATPATTTTTTTTRRGGGKRGGGKQGGSNDTTGSGSFDRGD